MSEWIKTSDELPENFTRCWIYAQAEDEEYEVIQADFQKEGLVGSMIYPKYAPCWFYDDDRDSVEVPQVSHWMPYFTPAPPEKDET